MWGSRGCSQDECAECDAAPLKPQCFKEGNCMGVYCKTEQELGYWGMGMYTLCFSLCSTSSSRRCGLSTDGVLSQLSQQFLIGNSFRVVLDSR